jgi:hypothetical protein
MIGRGWTTGNRHGAQLQLVGRPALQLLGTAVGRYRHQDDECAHHDASRGRPMTIYIHLVYDYAKSG